MKHPLVDIPEIIRSERMTTQEYVYCRLRNAIMLGVFEPGFVLTMRGLAQLMEMSLTPIREAVRRLSSENAIEIMDNRRMIIPKMSAKRFEELLALRIALECHAAIRALPYVCEITIEQLEEIDAKMDRDLAEDKIDRIILLNHAFHRTLFQINPHQTVMSAIESVWLQLGPFQRQANKCLKEHYIIDRHKEILAALRERNSSLLIESIENDIREGAANSSLLFLK